MKHLLPFRLYSIQESKSLNDLLVPAEPTSPVYHSSSYKNRESIKRKGLVPTVGIYTKNYTKKKNLGFELPPMIFVSQAKMGMARTYGGDLWEIDLNKVDVKWYRDPIHYNESNPFSEFEWYMTLDPIPPSALKLISSNEKEDDKREILLTKQMPFKKLRELFKEMNFIEEGTDPLGIRILTRGNDSDRITVKYDASDKSDPRYSNPNSVEWSWTVTKGGKAIVDNKFTVDLSTISNVKRDNDIVYSMIKKDLAPYL